MPISRKKACLPCRQSKARCSLELPCSRCSERGFSCAYEKSPAYRGPYPTPRAVASRLPPLQSDEGTTDHIAPPEAWNSFLAEDLLDPPQLATGFTWTPDPWFDSLDTLPAPLDIAQSSTNQPPPKPREDVCLQPMHPSDEDSALFRMAPVGILSPRKLANPEKFLTSKVLFGQVTSYPRAMIDGRGCLPPFIYPQCVLEGKSVDECRAMGNGNHSCLSEILAVCTSQLHMFFTRTTASSEYVWTTIYDYHRQLHQKIPSSNAHQLVEVLQATVIYLLTQALDIQTIEKNDIFTLVLTIREVGQQLHTLQFYQGSPSSCSPGRLSRRDWVAQESTRRTICLLYAIEAVFDVNIANRRQHCRGYNEVPLPSSRGPWEPIDNATWTAKYQTLINNEDAMYGGKQYLVIKDLRQLSGRRSANGEEETSDSTGQVNFKALEHWCETIDEFGLLLWMSVVMESRI
ncbi:hypothetical protein B0T25DRAFT_137351 [Lasiosphaeria hispida]|uniref:Zn(2)-C6 fungal-type domain-containing protein n=1 Tax=Lasiosphaeria hispida TaxID=260671 RepID=A0AAJ0MFD4_9PEZI|nr:hypothetical protein B0T25DRAFT_137351 [Lasiosphaeria hispida]